MFSTVGARYGALMSTCIDCGSYAKSSCGLSISYEIRFPVRYRERSSYTLSGHF
jgi:hypothetical protein